MLCSFLQSERFSQLNMQYSIHISVKQSGQNHDANICAKHFITNICVSVNFSLAYMLHLLLLPFIQLWFAEI